VNPFFTTHETFKLNAIMAVANFHGDIALASTIFDDLHMPFPDADIVHALVEERIFETRSEETALSIARAHDRDRGIRRIRLVLVSFRDAASPEPVRFHFYSDFHDFDSDSDSDNDVEDSGPHGAHLFYIA